MNEDMEPMEPMDCMGVLEFESRQGMNIEDEPHEELPEDEDIEPDCGDDDGLTDAEADAMTFASAGMGTDEDYGCFGGGDGFSCD